jgi:hypothetical protein
MCIDFVVARFRLSRGAARLRRLSRSPLNIPYRAEVFVESFCDSEFVRNYPSRQKVVHNVALQVTSSDCRQGYVGLNGVDTDRQA